MLAITCTCDYKVVNSDEQDCACMQLAVITYARKSRGLQHYTTGLGGCPMHMCWMHFVKKYMSEAAARVNMELHCLHTITYADHCSTMNSAAVCCLQAFELTTLAASGYIQQQICRNKQTVSLPNCSYSATRTAITPELHNRQ